jgi:hypothetical protein
MTLELYDRNGWVGTVARDDYIDDLIDAGPYTKAFLSNGDADQRHMDNIIEELDGNTNMAAESLSALLKQAEAPVTISDCSGDPRIDEFDAPEQEPSVQDEEDWAGVEAIIAENTE